jgi:hypothetical protein
MNANTNVKLLENIIVYIFNGLDAKNNLTEYHLSRLLYLADWFYAVRYERSLTGILWSTRDYEPFATDVMECIDANKDMTIVHQTEPDPAPIIHVQPEQNPVIETHITKILDCVIEKDNENDNAPRQLGYFLYSTYPIKKNVPHKRYGGTMDLLQYAREYKVEEEHYKEYRKKEKLKLQQIIKSKKLKNII